METILSPAVEERLQRLLLQARIIVEEADERLITNQAMLQQLNILRKEMYRGYYTLDRLRCHGHEEDNTKDHEVSNYFTPSKFNPAKRIRFCMASGQTLEQQLQQVFGSLECSKPTALTMEERLQRLLLRVRIIVEEADERLITNQAMLKKLNILRKEMYRGYYTLDRFRCHGHEEGNTKDHEVSSYSTPSKFNPTKRIRFCRPYSMHLLLDKCLFGRQMEMEHILSFLLEEDIPGAENTGVLPIIGPWKVRTFGSIDAEEHPRLASIAMDMAREMNGFPPAHAGGHPRLLASAATPAPSATYSPTPIAILAPAATPSRR
ncbi:hypothetical protein E2562_027744 [Oryza meyeriana var. granulata]|uniref:Rx N-terminal domain-containing protein n=1 Tax=Oryza meyeriana var. granulata TaxID=110450 RepID=A0A6G1EQH7_9ORYZ|nr:hypothetical protein E2562_027744 [Oryza meyeriana var. granulata]